MLWVGRGGLAALGGDRGLAARFQLVQAVCVTSVCCQGKIELEWLAIGTVMLASLEAAYLCLQASGVGL